MGMDGSDTSAAATSLLTFLGGAGTLTLDDRKLIVEQAQVMVEQKYVHRPLKEPMHAVNPVQRLRLIRARLERQTPTSMSPSGASTRVSTSSTRFATCTRTTCFPRLRGPCRLPSVPDREGPRRRDRPLPRNPDRGRLHSRGVRCRRRGHPLEGTPIARAVENNGALVAGSNRAANLARGLESLTLRPLVIELPGRGLDHVPDAGLDGNDDECGWSGRSRQGCRR